MDKSLIFFFLLKGIIFILDVVNIWKDIYDEWNIWNNEI